MLQQNHAYGNTSNRFFHAVQELKIASLLRQSNIRKGCGVSAYETFKFLLLLSFIHMNLFRFLASAHAEQAGASKNTFYRFMNNTSFNWHRFLLLLSSRVISVMSRLTRKGRVRTLALDDSPVPRNRSKSVELLARVFDHTVGHCIRGYNLLTLGWTDGFSFVPVAFNLLSSPNEENRYQEAVEGIDHRTVGYKTRMESMLHKPEAAFRLVQGALAAGIQAEYLLMDSWFTTEPFIGRIIKELGLDVIGMAKNGQQRYWFNGRLCTLGGLMHLVPSWNPRECYGSLKVYTRYQRIPLRVVFVRNRNKRSECIFLLSTDCSLSDEEIIRIYGNRWKIEVFFKASKSLFKLGREFQSRDYGASVCHTAIVFTRYILLEWIKRQEQDPRSYGQLFYDMCDDVSDMELGEAFKSLMTLFSKLLAGLSGESTKFVKSLLTDWFASQSRYVQGLLGNLAWES